jgi:hypothetical protein
MMFLELGSLFEFSMIQCMRILVTKLPNTLPDYFKKKKQEEEELIAIVTVS